MLLLSLALILASSAPEQSLQLARRNCDRCVSADDLRTKSPLPVPENGIVYSFVGEFAHGYKWWVIDLDTGRIRMVHGGDTLPAQPEIDVLLAGDPLKSLQSSAISAWKRPFPRVRQLYFAPGMVCECSIVHGGRMVPFDPFDPADKGLVEAVTAAIESVRQVR